MNQEGAFYCTSCSNTTRNPKMKGRGWIEVILWLCYLIPGLIYSIWRRSGTPSVCPSCEKETLIPAALAKSEGAASQTQRPEAREEVECPWCAERTLAKAKLCKHCGKDIVTA